MPRVSRNLSLPSSIEARKKRPETLLYRSNTEVHGHCPIQRSKPVNLNFTAANRPSFLPTITNTTRTCNKSIVTTSANTTNSNNKQNEVSKDETINESNDKVAEPTNSKASIMGVDTASTRGGTLSQPCLSISSVGATQIFPHLFLGSQKDVVDENMMRANGITYVLNVSKTCTKPEFIDEHHFRRISVHDSYQEKMTPHMREAIEFIEKVRKQNQRVIVHCLAGVSRSATVAIAYVLHYLRISFEEAYKFVKEKRPSISPNFNFLGQLMEFEKSLRLSGHLTCKRTGSLSEEGSEDDSESKFDCPSQSSPLKNSTKLTLFKTKSDCSPLVMPATCSFKCSTQATAPCQATGTTLRISKPTSSLCRRRNGPTFSKGSFATSSTNCNNNSSNRKCDSALPKLYGAKTPFGDDGLVVDVHVNVPPPTARVADASRRLGSDGFEKDETMVCDPTDGNAYQSDAFSPLRNQGIEQPMDCSEDSEKFAKPSTAPNTPVISRNKSHSLKHNNHTTSQLAPPVHRHRRCASGGGISTDVLQSPLSMKRRFEARTERSSSIGELSLGEQSMDVDHSSVVSVKRGASFTAGSYYDHSEPSTRSPRKFISVNSRSPKILRKSFQLNLRPVYSSTGGGRNKSEEAAAPVSAGRVLGIDTPAPVFDCSHSMSDTSEPLTLEVNKGRGRPEQATVREGTTPDAEDDDTLGIDSVTLSSPNVDKDGLAIFPKIDSARVTSPATCPVLTNDVTDPCFPGSTSPPRFMYKGPFTYTSSSKARQITDAKTSQPFVLSASCDLKLKWRNKDRRRQSVDSGYLSSQASSQSSSSFTSPTSQQIIFGSGSEMENRTSSPVNNTCHGAFVTSDDVTNSNNDPDSRNANVRQRNAVVCS